MFIGENTHWSKGELDETTFLREVDWPQIWVSLLKTPKTKEILEFFGIQSLGTGGLDRSVAINGRPDRACQGLVSVSASGPVGSLLSPW